MPITTPTPLRFNVDEYMKMADAGLFAGKRVELLLGEIIEMNPQRAIHVASARHMNQCSRSHVRCSAFE